MTISTTMKITQQVFNNNTTATATDSIPQQQQHRHVPFWMGHEDPHHIQLIIKMYSKQFNLMKSIISLPSSSSLSETASPYCSTTPTTNTLNEDDLIRYLNRPIEFVGKVIRYPLLVQQQQPTQQHKNPLTTIDMIITYKRDSIQQGKSFPYANTYYSRTVWDESDGIPIEFTALSKYEYNRTCNSSKIPYTLVILPILYENNSNVYKTMIGDHHEDHQGELGYSDLLSKCVAKLFSGNCNSASNYNSDDEEEEEDYEDEENDYLDDGYYYHNDLIDQELNIDRKSSGTITEEKKACSHDDYLQSLLNSNSKPNDAFDIFACGGTMTHDYDEDNITDDDGQAEWDDDDDWEENNKIESPQQPNFKLFVHV